MNIIYFANADDVSNSLQKRKIFSLCGKWNIHFVCIFDTNSTVRMNF